MIFKTLHENQADFKCANVYTYSEFEVRTLLPLKTYKLHMTTNNVRKMPYILMEDRPKYEESLSTLIKILKEQPVERIDGELNYIITRILKETYPLRYFNINRAIGVMEACKLEYYRRVAAPYEDTKIEQNGDV